MNSKNNFSLNVNGEGFSGPLDLLLSLIDEQKLSLSELSLSQVTEQYLVYLDKMEEKKPEEMADFLVVATRLLLLKSKQLLPQFSLEEDDGPSLEEQLRLYKKFIEVAKKLNKNWISGERAIFRVEPTRKQTEFCPPANLSISSLQQSIEKLLNRIKPPKPLPRTHVDKAVLMKEKINQIRNWLKEKKSFSLSQILNDSKNKTEVIVTFLSLLELVKAKDLLLKQDNNFSDILVEKI